VIPTRKSVVTVLFSGEHLVVDNERIALSVPHHSDFTGCIPAALLTEMLEASPAPVVEMRPVGSDAVLVKLGDTSVTLPMLAADTFDFQMPAVPTQNHIQGVARQFFDAVEHCLQPIELKSAYVYEHLGITLIPDGRHVRMYSTDRYGTTLSFAELTLPVELEQPIIIPAAFCQQMLALAEQAHSNRLVLVDRRQQRRQSQRLLQQSPKLRSRLADALADHALFVADDTRLFGHTLRSDKLDFDRARKNLLPADYAEAMVAIHQQLQMALKRASRIDGVMTELAIENGTATFRSRSPRGDEISDTILLPGHADIRVPVDAPLLFDRHSKFDKILFTDRCAILTKDDHLCLVAAPTP
jgi:hypothetical protein